VLADAVEADHVRSVLSPEHLTDVLSTDKHTVKPWFIGKISFAPPVQDYAAEGFPLVGGRLDVLDHQTVAALVYHYKKHVINLFIWPAADAAVPPQLLSTARGYHMIHWTDGGMTFWAISDADPTQLQRFAELLQHGVPATTTAP
jgi:anti-sigma factor RsiW